MTRMIAALLCAPVGMAAFAAEEVVTIPTRSGVTVSYLLVQYQAATAKIVVISFIGGYGSIPLPENRAPTFEATANFVVRIRDQLADADIADAIVDAPSDNPHRMADTFRLGPEHLADMRALIADVKKRFVNAKVILLGTSRGTVSTAALAAKLGDSVQGAILTSTATSSDRMGAALSRFDFTTIKVPVLLVHHRYDGCVTSPYLGARRLAKYFPLVSVSGGGLSGTDPCEPLSPHGFYGREAPVVQAMKDWMLGREFARDIR